MFSFTDREGRKVPFLKVAIPTWIGFAVNASLIGHMSFLESQRPATPDPAHDFVLEQTMDGKIYYISHMDQIVSIGLWITALTYMTGLFIYGWRLGIFHKR